MRRNIITQAKAKHRKARSALKRAERKYAVLARKYDRARELMMSQNDLVGKASQDEKALHNEVKFYEAQIEKLKHKPAPPTVERPRLSLPKAPPPKSAERKPATKPRAKKKKKPKAKPPATKKPEVSKTRKAKKRKAKKS
jgi:hypothetical protein